MEKLFESKEFNEWQSRPAWVNPQEFEVNGDELEWNKLTRENAVESFRSLERMRPFLDKGNLFEKKNGYACREKLSEMKDDDGNLKFNDQDLRFFDLYFGNDHIYVTKIESGFDITNGRHRLLMAKENGIKELPVLLNEKVKKESIMSNFELADIEKESLEQNEEAEEMKEDIEQHRERAGRLEDALQKIRAASAEIGSDQFREVEQRTEDAKVETERQLEEIRKRRDELLFENKELAGKVIEQNEKRKEVHQQVSKIKMMFEGASDEFKSQINRAGDVLSEELGNLAILQEDLLEARNALENLNI